MQGNASLTVELSTAHFSPTQTPRNLDSNSFCTSLHCRLHRLTHGATERHARRKLFSDTLGDQLGINLGILYLKDVQLHLLAGKLFQVATNAVSFSAATTDDNARACGVNIHPNTLTSAFDLNLGDAGSLHTCGEQAADGDVFLDVVAVLLAGLGAVGEPA